MAGWQVYGVSREKGTTSTGPILSWEEFWEARQFDPGCVGALIHLAAFRPANLDDPASAGPCLEHNALLTLRLAEWAAEKCRARFLYASAGNIYGFQNGPVKETAPVVLDQRACFYLASKYLGEVFLERTRLARGLSAASFRISSLYGPGMPQHSFVARFVTLAREKAPLPLRHGGAERFDLVYVDDVANLLVRAATSTAEGIFNVGGGRSISVAEAAAVVNEAFRNPAGCIDLDACPAPVQPGFAPLCLERTRETFGCHPRSFESGIADYRRWLEAQTT